MVERVIALVSRVQGTLEFEVQPLREYFAARYLYDTAPYSPPGDERKGTKPDRFDAIARNFYWLNVTRFYAGCFSKGELASLVDRLQELSRDGNFRRLSHPRTLAAILLSDWVFSQHPRSVSEVVKLITDGLGLRYLLASPSRRVGSGPAVVLPKRSGNDELVNKCFNMLRSNPARDFALDIIDLIRGNASKDEIQQKWNSEVQRTSAQGKATWFEYGLHLGVLALASGEMLDPLLSDARSDPALLPWLFRARRTEYIEVSEDRCAAMVDLILNGHIKHARPGKSIIGTFAEVLSPWRYRAVEEYPRDAPLSAAWDGRRFSPIQLNSYRQDSAVLAKCASVVRSAIEMSNKTVEEWSTQIAPWDALVETARAEWGDRWQLSILANAAAGIRSKTETCSIFSNLFDHSVSLCRRVRYARLRAGSAAWWGRTFERAVEPHERVLGTLIDSGHVGGWVHHQANRVCPGGHARLPIQFGMGNVCGWSQGDCWIGGFR